MKLQLRVKPAFESGSHPQKVAPTPSLTSVHLKAKAKGFQEQKTDLSSDYYSWRNLAIKNVASFLSIFKLGVLSMLMWEIYFGRVFLNFAKASKGPFKLS